MCLCYVYVCIEWNKIHFTLSSLNRIYFVVVAYVCASQIYAHSIYVHFCLYCKKKIPNKICWISLKWLSSPHTVDIRHVYIFDHGSFYYTSTFPIHNIFILYRLHLLRNGFWWDAVAVACVVAIAVLAILSISSPFFRWIYFAITCMAHTFSCLSCRLWIKSSRAYLFYFISFFFVVSTHMTWQHTISLTNDDAHCSCICNIIVRVYYKWAAFYPSVIF